MNNSLFGVVATVNDKVVGTGRIVGDGAIFYYIQDLMVMPKYQKRGMGSAILDALIVYINNNAQWPCYISLFTSKGLEKLFTPYGFEGSDTFLYGMSISKSSKQVIRRDESKS